MTKAERAKLRKAIALLGSSNDCFASAMEALFELAEMHESLAMLAELKAAKPLNLCEVFKSSESRAATKPRKRSER